MEGNFFHNRINVIKIIQDNIARMDYATLDFLQ